MDWIAWKNTKRLCPHIFNMYAEVAIFRSHSVPSGDTIPRGTSNSCVGGCQWRCHYLTGPKQYGIHCQVLIDVIYYFLYGVYLILFHIQLLLSFTWGLIMKGWISFDIVFDYYSVSPHVIWNEPIVDEDTTSLRINYANLFLSFIMHYDMDNW